MLEAPGVSIWQKGEVIHVWEVDEIVDLTIDDAAGTRSRISATRVVLFGGLGFLAPKHSVTAFATLNTADDTHVIEVPGAAPPALRGNLLSLWGRDHRLFAGDDASGGASDLLGPSVEERLRTLARLHADGIVSDVEFETKRSELIALL